jgi:hypothetical protein
MRSIPRLSWLGARQFKSSGDSRKNRPGRKQEHFEAQTYALARLAQHEFDTRIGLADLKSEDIISDIPFELPEPDLTNLA